MAIACLRLVTFFPDRPLRRVPAFLSRMTFSTLALAALLYLVAITAPGVVDVAKLGWTLMQRLAAGFATGCGLIPTP